MDEIKAANRFSMRDWLTLALGVALALLWREVFSLANLTYGLPALGACVFTFAAWAAVLLVLGARAKWTRANIFLAVVINLLALSCAFQWSEEIRFVSFLVIFCGSVMGFLSLAGTEYHGVTEPGAIKEAALDFFRGVFVNWGRPFRAVYALAPENKRALGGVLLGLVIALPLLAVVLFGMGFADAIFDIYVFQAITSFFADLGRGTLLLRTLSITFWSLVFFSSLYFLRHEPGRKEPLVRMNPLPVSALLTVEALLTAVCALFAVFQFKYLFGGAETAEMAGGWAEYARSGFFSLIGVAAIVMATALACSRAGRESVLGRVLTLALVLLTFVMLASAAYRLYLYVLAYGLSVMRLMAAWAMLATGVCLVLVAVKSLRAGFRFWPWAAGIILAMWVCFAFLPAGKIVSHYNVDAYIDGRLDQIDATYLYTLGPDSLDALRKLRESGLEWNQEGWPDGHLDTPLIRNLADKQSIPWARIVLG